jgi:hypothetical protein
MPPLLYLEYDMQGILDRSKYLKGEEAVKKDAEGTDTFKAYQFAKFIGDSCGDRWEEAAQLCREKFVEIIILSEDISENGYQEKAERNESHHRKIRERSRENDAPVFKKIKKTLCDNFYIVHCLFSFSLSRI